MQLIDENSSIDRTGPPSGSSSCPRSYSWDEEGCGWFVSFLAPEERRVRRRVPRFAFWVAPPPSKDDIVPSTTIPTRASDGIAGWVGSVESVVPKRRLRRDDTASSNTLGDLSRNLRD